MKNISSELTAHFGADCTTLALIFKAKRSDGRVLGFTTADLDLVFDIGDGDGVVTYLADTGIVETATQTKDVLSVTNKDVIGFLDSTVITEADIRAGLWNDAELKLAIVNYMDLTMGCMKLQKGNTGHISLANGLFTAEVRGIAQRLTAQIVQTYGPLCRAELGSSGTSSSAAVIPTLEAGGYTSADYSLAWRLKSLAPGTSVQVKFKAQSGAGLRINKAAILKTVAGSSTVIGSTPITFSGAAGILIAAAGEGVSDVIAFVIDPANDYWVVTYANDGSNVGISYHTWPSTLSGSEPFIQYNPTGFGDKTGTASVGSGVFSADFLYTRVLSGFTVFGTPIDPDSTYLCGVTLANYRQTGSISSVPDAFHIVPTSGLLKKGSATPTAPAPDDWFNDGNITFTSGPMNGFSLEVKEWDGTTLTLYLPMPFQPGAGDTFTIEPGCDKTIGNCYSKFNNIVNFRGEPFIPTPDITMGYPDAK